ncbi:LOW QUALITY PROTEIN: Hypothetical protein PHPALM_19678 [Phytophthora palmivora]|uniref:Uncharacterized protein n=1 Tax=Phytophthora palmivora TaxID=4796 RepID=A0A2P4XGW4_9STRA|nr:LOW QUALITY PROTEIN: Hypothetical protein PHPALM_19678 [Phytophthora palmivora]
MACRDSPVRVQRSDRNCIAGTRNFLANSREIALTVPDHGSVDKAIHHKRHLGGQKKLMNFEYVKQHPWFYFEEIRAVITERFSDLTNLSDVTLCRAVRFDFDLSRKKLTKRARESVPAERQEFVARLSPFYSCPEQLMKLLKTVDQ